MTALPTLPSPVDRPPPPAPPQGMRKEQIVEMKQQKNILNEKRILDMMDHPFVLKLAGHYHDSAEVPWYLLWLHLLWLYLL